MNKSLEMVRRVFGYVEASFREDKIRVTSSYFLSRQKQDSGELVLRRRNNGFRPYNSTVSALDKYGIALANFGLDGLEFVQITVGNHSFNVNEFPDSRLLAPVTKISKSGKPYVGYERTNLGKKVLKWMDYTPWRPNGMGSEPVKGYGLKLCADIFADERLGPWVRSVIGKTLREAGYHLAPAHNSWIFKGDNILIPVRRRRIPEQLRQNARRAGKDIMTQSVGDVLRNQLILVVPKTGTVEHDGDFALNPRLSGWEAFGLYRGSVRLADGNFAIIKGRGIPRLDFDEHVAAGLASAGIIIRPRQAIRAVISEDNLKWVGVKPGLYTADRLYKVKDENHVDMGVHRVNPAYAVLAANNDSHRSFIQRLIFQNLKKTYQSLAGGRDLFGALYEDILENETGGAQIAGKLVLYATGLATDQDIRDLSKTLLKRGLSAKVRNVRYMAIIFAERVGDLVVTPDRPVLSRKAVESFGLLSSDSIKRVLMARNPVIGRQNFINISVDETRLTDVFGPNVELVVLHHSLAVYCQGDGDDHALFYMDKPFNEMGICADDLVKQKPINPAPEAGVPVKGDDAELEAFMAGAVNQSRIGTMYNTMLDKLKVVYLMATDKLEELGYTLETAIDAITRKIGTFIHIFAQGVKKLVRVITPGEASKLETPEVAFSEIVEDLEKSISGDPDAQLSALVALTTNRTKLGPDFLSWATGTGWAYVGGIEGFGFTHKINKTYRSSSEIETKVLHAVGLEVDGFKAALADENLKIDRFLKAVELYACAHMQEKVVESRPEPRAIALAAMHFLKWDAFADDVMAGQLMLPFKRETIDR